MLLAVLGSTAPAQAQNRETEAELVLDGLQARPEERAAWELTQQQQHIRAREAAEKILKRDPSSFVAHLVLGYAQHYAEANLPRALYHLNRALALYEKRFGMRPGPEQPWRWYSALLRQLADTHGDMEHHGDKLAYIARFNELYDPDLVAERAWPLMKLGRYTEARLAAELGLASNRPSERVVALNALCAIEFEAGNDGQSYEACKRAIDDGMAITGTVSAVDLTNFAEASRSLFKLDEAERIALEATTAVPSWYGNPWLELGELYVRQARFPEALSALKQVPDYRRKRPPHVRDADQNELRRVLASFLLMLAKPEQAFEVTSRALSAPDRRAHNSRDPAQDTSVLALLDYRARRVAAELELEHAATLPWYERPWAYGKAWLIRLRARQSAAVVQRLLSDDERLVGSLRIGTARSAVMPPWLVGELVHVLGAGVLEEALVRARKQDKRPGAGAYYDAIAAEVAWRHGDEETALLRARRSLAKLGPSEVLLQARVLAIAADAAQSLGQMDDARAFYDDALQRDSGVFRRLELPLAVEIRSSGEGLSQEVASMLARSPRFDSVRGGLSLAVRGDRSRLEVCLSGSHAQVIVCAEVAPKSDESPHDHAARATTEVLQQLFAPRVDLSQMDINSLDGHNLPTRDALKTLFQ
jgi:tetratricopeptide (TPR) repeat protein